MNPAIELSDVTLDYGSNRVLENLSLTIRPGEILALLGPSGCGKSTVLRLILGFVAPTHGNLLLDGEVVSSDGQVCQRPEERRLAVVFQDLALWPHLTVQENLAFGLEAHRVPVTERKRRIANMLDRVGLADKAKRYPGVLSGGERQRVAIARALVLEPRAVLLDEPLANVDVALKQELLGLFGEVLKERNVTTIYVTHDLSEAMVLGQQAVVLEAGCLIQQGSFSELRSTPKSPFVKALVNNANWKNILIESGHAN